MFKTRFSLLLFLFFLLASCTGAGGEDAIAGHPGGDGLLIQSVFSPFQETLEQSQVKFPATRSSSTSATTTSVTTSRYQEFAFRYETNSLALSAEPFCKEGGQYLANVFLKVFNKAGEVEINQSHNLYYCKTTEDLLKRIEIPLSWVSSELLLYCNDGSSINFADVNPEVFTSQVNAYKVCVLKNLDLETDNTVIYGFDVGNVFVDSDPKNTFSQDTLSGQVVGALQGGELQSSIQVNQERTEFVSVPFITRCTPILREVKGGFLIEEGQTCTNIPQSDETIIESTISQTFPNFVSFTKLRDDTLRKETLFEVVLEENVNVTTQSFSTTEGDPFLFDFDPRETFFVLRSTPEELTVPLLSRFPIPEEFGLSRVVFFRGFGFGDARVALAYETPAKFVLTTQSTDPIYTIEFERLEAGASTFFTRSQCMDTLSILGAQERNTLRSSDLIICKVDGSIMINSPAFDAIHGQGSAFSLFKNIITDLD